LNLLEGRPKVAEEKEKIKKNQYEKALDSYSRAIKAFRKMNYEKSSELLDSFIKTYDSEKELVNRAKIYLAICQERMKKEVIPLKTFDDYYQYSVYKINQGDYEEAVELLKKALEINPNEGKVFYLLADAYCLMGKTEECLDNLKKAIRIDKFFAILAQNERDFESIKNDKKFKLIVRMA